MSGSARKLLSYALLSGCLLAQTGVQTARAQSYDAEQTQASRNNAYGPNGIEMVGDALIARPLMLGATVLGTGVFLVSLPFSLLGGNVEQAGEALVADPARATFVRCLGCIE